MYTFHPLYFQKWILKQEDFDQRYDNQQLILQQQTIENNDKVPNWPLHFPQI